jgi:glutamate-5-semialdehyde dehydrogenase
MTFIATERAISTPNFASNGRHVPRRVVIKLGTNVLMRPDGRVALGLLCGLVESVAALRERGIEVVLVSSGAIGLGMERLGMRERPSEVPLIQACAATGQSSLMSLYDEAFETMGCRIAQVLLTEDDFRDPIRYENLRATLRALLTLGVIPIVNENDTVSTMELDRPAEVAGPVPEKARLFGDNDKLSALLMKHIDADLLVLLSDIDGLYDRHPGEPGAKLVPEVTEITDAIRAYAHGGNGRGRGGMASKLEAARIVMEAGRRVVIANGRTPQLLEQICDGELVGTIFLPQALHSGERAVDRVAMEHTPFTPMALSRQVEERPAVSHVRAVAEAAKRAARQVAPLNEATRNAALEAIAKAVEGATDQLIAANVLDLGKAEELKAAGDLSDATISRLRLTPAKLAEMVAQVRAVAALPEPLGRVLEATELDEHLELDKRSVPVGVLAVIFEARPDAVTQISALALKSGNAVLMKPGKEVEQTATALVKLIRNAIGSVGLPEDAVALVLGREHVPELLGYADLVDMVIPRGSKMLVEYVQRNTHIPVLGHAEGVCHIFIDASANPELSLRVIDDAKRDYPAACNAVETVLVHEGLAETVLTQLAARLTENGVRVLGDERVRALLARHGVDSGLVENWHTEYGDLTLAIRLVPDLDAAIDHIHTYGSAHTEAILTEDANNAERFLNEVDAAGVFHNASTRFADGFRYGFGAEVGISTSRFHARGPVGLDGLTTYKYVLRGAGQGAGDYRGSEARRFTHRKK